MVASGQSATATPRRGMKIYGLVPGIDQRLRDQRSPDAGKHRQRYHLARLPHIDYGPEPSGPTR